MAQNSNKYNGLTSFEAKKLREKYGPNILVPQKKVTFAGRVFSAVGEPMFLLLIAAAIIYFFLGEPKDGATMLVFVCAAIGIEVFQELRTDKTLKVLKRLASARVSVVRDGKEVSAASEDIVPGDLIIVREGDKIPADGRVLKANDLSVDESSLTGEAEPVWKFPWNGLTEDERSGYCYAGTLVNNGTGYIIVEKTGLETAYGKIGVHVANAPKEKTPLQKQTDALVKYSSFAAAFMLLLVCIITYLNTSGEPAKRIIESVLAGVTLAMALIPEEFPVILTVFLSIGAARLAKKNSLVKRLSSVETLGSVSVLCVDKTGTITKNEMTVVEEWIPDENYEEFVEIMGLACETDTYDPMEQAMIKYCEEKSVSREHIFGGELLYEYAFTSKLKMMGHIWRHDGELIAAVKGSPEMVLKACTPESFQKDKVWQKINRMSEKGYRVIAVADSRLDSTEDIPERIDQLKLSFKGVVALADPPADNVKEDIKTCLKAGIRVVMITGDNGITAKSIAEQVGIDCPGEAVTGDMLDEMDDTDLREAVKHTSVFSRVMPEHKMRIVKALAQNGEIVAMTGDGVNDAPALKYADIGIAMGRRGSEVSREAADLVLLDDNFSTIVQTVSDGRRIYDNIRKAVGYVFTIHIPIALSSLLGPLLNIDSSSLFLLPVHVALLELLIDPTCSVVLERQPAERGIMDRKPRNPKESLLTKGLFSKSIIQGLFIFAAAFGSYLTFLNLYSNPEQARSAGLLAIMAANLLLVQVNSSNIDSMWSSVKKLYRDKVMWIVNLATVIGIAVIIYTPVSSFLKLSPLTAVQTAVVCMVSIASVLWYEIVKAVKRRSFCIIKTEKKR